MYKIDLNEVAKQYLSPRLCSLAGVDANNNIVSERCSHYLAETLRLAGGVPIISEELDATQLSSFAHRVFHGAIKHSLARILKKRPHRTFMLMPSGTDSLKNKVALIQRVNINSADKATLLKVPKITPLLAEKIIKERDKNGVFRNIKDLDKRVRGIGQKTASAISNYLVFEFQLPGIHNNNYVTGDFDRDFTCLLQLHGTIGDYTRFANALEYVMLCCKDQPSPYNRHLLSKKSMVAAGEVHDSTWVGALMGRQYYEYLGVALPNAQTSIDIVMFHIALGGSNHPSRMLLQKIIERKRHGVAVRVLLDQDRKEDPYKSTIINTAAKNFLADAGVEVKLDSTDKLLHSKFILIDNRIIIIGSHNWSTGSFFNIDDFSVAIESASLALFYGKRFNEMWG